MPFIAQKTKEGILDYSNETPKDIIIIDSTTLEDYIKFHDIEYEIASILSNIVKMGVISYAVSIGSITSIISSISSSLIVAEELQELNEIPITKNKINILVN